MPDLCVASDFIVGFPTETDADFAATVELLRECRFKNSFIFKYSPRPGTVAIDRYADDVPEEIESARRNYSELLEVQRKVSEANNREMIGVRATVLVESQSRLAQKPEYPAAGTVELGWKPRTAAGVGRRATGAAHRPNRGRSDRGVRRRSQTGRPVGGR